MKLLYNAESGLQAAHVTPCFAENCDVLVVGAGTAGAIAAIRAARGGMRVCAVDRLSFPGGMLTSAVFGYYYGAKGGLYEEIDTRARALQENAEAFFPSQGIQRLARMQVLEEMFAEEGVCTRYETFVLGVFVEGRRIAGVRCVSHGRVEDLSCAFAIDGTSEGYLCAMAGCAASLGRACDGRTQPFSLVSLSCAAGGGPTRHSNSDFGYATAVSFFNSLVSLLLIGTSNFVSKKLAGEALW
ncbi:MAG: FAD-dependent oxidoreductase [Clostridiales bacterium]|nr:FAD-dependent oxidoreductase [Clostridiales bacterium]